jgi:glycosyltransferase involved in cell wall biosynthesis
VPHYRCKEWLSDTLSSLVGQSHRPDGIVVIDDCSSPPPTEIVQRFPEVTLLAAAENVGPYRLIQQVIGETDYDAYLFQDADDWSSPDRLETLLAEAERTGAEMVGSNEMRLLCDEGKVVPWSYPRDVNAAIQSCPNVYPMVQHTALVSRDLVMRLGGFASGMRFGGDTEFLRRAHFAATIVNVPQYLYFRRIRTGSLTTAPETGFQSLERKRTHGRIWGRARANRRAVARGEAPNLAPYVTAGPVLLEHRLGPGLRPSGNGPYENAPSVPADECAV